MLKRLVKGHHGHMYSSGSSKTVLAGWQSMCSRDPRQTSQPESGVTSVFKCILE